ncbi:MAG: hypothetical protein ACLQAH_08370 [Limisphaerales bacterium]
MKLFYTGPAVKTELLVVMLEKHGIAAAQSFVDPAAPDDGDLGRPAQVFGRRQTTTMRINCSSPSAGTNSGFRSAIRFRPAPACEPHARLRGIHAFWKFPPSVLRRNGHGMGNAKIILA